ncbi:DUF305 domain-containing protein [Actinophytocola oryzae]|uniref:DUF305 domain-containing protein n=1 Tax=Actinophytocola oryzae TaxID=502181 RepID=UPI001FBADC3B|nr:DUF305 domain-containing protein [Actinophytocola oryzae]
MSKTYWTYRRSVVVLGAVLALGPLAACSTTPPPPSNPGPVIVPGRPGEEASTIAPGEATGIDVPEPNDADKHFMQDMIVHHQQAIWMSDLAPERASSRDVKELASRISDVQGLEIGAMNRWLSLHAVPTVNPTAPDHHTAGDHGAMPGMATQEQLDQLRNARGAAFDTLWLQLMIAHHQGALTMAEEVRQKGLDVKVQEIADDVVVEQTDEIQRMRAWLNG